MRWILAIVLVAGCSTPYQSPGFRGGVSETNMGEGRWFIEVKANAYTSTGTAMQYIHRRAAELCQAYGGYDGYVFEGVDGADKLSANTYGTTTVVHAKPERSAIVRCTRSEPQPVAATPELEDPDW
jgi:hypothetical protein